MSVKVSKINIKIGKKTIELSVDEAKELQELLNDTFGKQEKVYLPSTPIIIERPYIRPYPWRYWRTDYTWSDTTGNVSAGPGSSVVATYSLNSQN